MIDFVTYYVMLVKSEKITIDKVPSKYRESVSKALIEE